MKAYRHMRTQDCGSEVALAATLADYRSPVSAEVMDFQIQLAIGEASDLEFVPDYYRGRY